MMILPALALFTSLQSPSAATQPVDRPTAPIGVCVRWAANPDRVADAIIVTSSGSAALDRKVRDQTLSMTMRRPTSAKYQGQWVGIIVATSPTPPKVAVPSCAHLSVPKPAI
jgi:hypothetical protein